MRKNIYYRIQHVSDSRYLHGKDDAKNVTTKKEKEYDKQAWAFILLEDQPNPLSTAGMSNIDLEDYPEMEIQAYYGLFLHKGSGKYLSLNSDNDIKLKTLSEGDTKQQWWLKLVDGELFIISRHNNKALHSNKDKDPKVFLEALDTDAPNQPWKAIPAASEWDFDLKSFEYTEMDGSIPVDPRPVDLLVNFTVDNQSNATFNQEITRTVEKSETFEWGFNQSLMIGTTVGLEMSVPKLGTASSKRTVEMTVESHQTWIENRKENYSINFHLEVPPKTKAVVNGSFDWINNAEYDFEAHYLVQAYSASANGGKENLTTDEMRKILEASEEFTAEILDEDQSPVCLEIRLDGEFKGSYGTTTVITVYEEDPEDEAV